MTIETALAKSALDLVTRRDPNKIYHRMTRAELLALTKTFAWEPYLTATGVPQFATINVTEPDFFKGVDAVIASNNIADLKTYMRWHVIHGAAPLLSSAFVNENFDFYGRVLTGRKALLPRWKRCVQYTDDDLGEALGQLYVDATFGAEGKRRMLELVGNLERSLRKDIDGLDWMTIKTKQQALAKLAMFTKKIGYPDKWRDYSALTIVRGDLVGNSKRANEFEHRRQLAKIGKPLDRTEWLMSPPTVNAYYNPLMNEIVFPAGILQPPFFDRSLDDAVNYGSIGGVIGHEMTHGFDDQGRQFDKEGNLADWWTESDAMQFTKRTDCVKTQYGGYTAVDTMKIDGELTLGENVADNGGLRIAHMALMEALAGKTPAPIDGFTAEQRFFLGWGQIWCENVRPEQARLEVTTDVHSPGRWRVNGVVANMPEFAKAFGCKAGQPMVPANQCKVW
jgi:endothelin-converting enzyme/putative endopeptidase